MAPGGILAAPALREGLAQALRAAATAVLGPPGAGAAAAATAAAKGGDGLDLVTAADLALQAHLAQSLAALVPGSVVTGEEGYRAGAAAGAALVWLVDPLDGTVNFAAGLPFYASAAVLLAEGAPVLAAVHDIPRGTVHTAQAGQGAFRDGMPLRHRAAPVPLGVLSSGLVADLAARAPAALAGLMRGYKLRNLGAQALHLCLAAEGRVAFVASREARGWDDLAGALIAREAGLAHGSYDPGVIRAPDAEQHSLCAPPALFDDLARVLAQSREPRP